MRNAYYQHPLVSRRRYSIVDDRRNTASELTTAPKTVELEQRLSRLEVRCRQMQEQLEISVRKAAALQAELDHLTARVRH
jgi:hypothetical protein